MTEPDVAEESVIRQGKAERGGTLGLVAPAPPLPQGPTVPSPTMTLESLVHAVAEEFGVAPGSLATPSRVRHLSRARAVIAHRALHQQLATLTEVAGRLGRTPATLWAGMQRYCRDDDEQIIK